MLLAECGAGSVDIRLGETVTAAERADRFAVETSGGRYEAPALVLATGGLSIPKMGASGLSHDIARRFGLAIIAPRPGLVALRLPPTGTFFDPALAGVSLETVASFDKARFRERMLVTHRGLSGPAILQISSYWRPGEPITLDFAPGANPAALLVDAKRLRPRAMLQTVLADLLPDRLARSLVAADLKPVELANIPDRALNLFGARLAAMTVTPTGSEGYAKAEVTVGGVDTHELSSKTMQAQKVAGLFVIGEAVDVTGWLGGYNFQWAWSSGWCAGEAI